MMRRFLFVILIFFTGISCIAPSHAEEKIRGMWFLDSTSFGENTLVEGMKIFKTMIRSRFFRFDYANSMVTYSDLLTEPRARLHGRVITLSSFVTHPEELTKLFTHELAHVIDLYVLTDENGSDRSKDFYRIDWQEPYVKYAGTSLASFVSGYAATSQYEDFAESLVWYVFHNADFADRALKNESLRQKYLFFQNTIFPNGDFYGTDFSVIFAPQYFWDTTKIPFDLKKYLYFLMVGI